MAPIPMEHGLAVAALLLLTGLAGVLARRNSLFLLMSIEIMMNAAGLAFIVAGAQHRSPDGQVFFLFILAVAAAEVAVGLALIIQIYHRHKTVDADAVSTLGD